MASTDLLLENCYFDNYNTFQRMNNGFSSTDEQNKQRSSLLWYAFCLRCHSDDSNLKQPEFWTKCCPYPFCPTYSSALQTLSIILIFLICWGLSFTILGSTAAPNGQLFNLTLMVIASYCGGWLVLKITTLPALIGMLITGILWQNFGLIHIEGNYVYLTSELRKVALVIILSRAGLGLDLPTMKKNYSIVLKLGLLPWIVECVSIAVITHYVLDIPWIWGFMLGSMIASVSPAVVVPCLFKLKEQGYGVDKGIPTLVLAAAGIDDSISVSVFGIIHSAIFSTSSLIYTISKGPLSIISGILFGIFWGTLLKYIPQKNDMYVVPLRFLLLFGGGLLAVFGSNAVGWGGAGPVAIVSAGFFAAIHWSKQDWPVNNNPVSDLFRIFWLIFEPILFAFTGAQVKISELDLHTLQLGTICLLVCVILRMLSTILVGYRSVLNNKEKLFIGITWMAKATVQAALGPASLDSVRTNPSSSSEDYYRANTVLTISILSIILTAPLGAILIAILGPRLLSKQISTNEVPAARENVVATEIL